jgi:predicted branched-subunit amino acid permease
LAVLGGAADAFGLTAVVLAASMVGFGSLARELGIDWAVAVISTATVWGLPGQIAMVELFAVGAPMLAIAVAVAGANARFMPMAIAMLPSFRGGLRRWAWCYGLVHLMSINTWTGLMRRAPTLPVEQRAPYFIGYSAVCMAAGLIGTILGFVLAGVLPRVLTIGLVFLNPIYLLLMFAGVRFRAGVLALFAGVAVGPIAHIASPSWGLPATGIIGGTLAFLIDRGLSRRG